MRSAQRASRARVEKKMENFPAQEATKQHQEHSSSKCNLQEKRKIFVIFMIKKERSANANESTQRCRAHEVHEG